MFRPDGKSEKQALAKIETTEPRKATLAPDTQAPDTQAPVPTDELTKLLGPEDGRKEGPRRKIRSKVVLKAVADVKKLRAVTAKSLPAPAKPVQAKSATKLGGKKKSKTAFADDAFAPAFKEAMPPPVRVGVQPRLSDADAGPPSPALPPRK